MFYPQEESGSVRIEVVEMDEGERFSNRCQPISAATAAAATLLVSFVPEEINRTGNLSNANNALFLRFHRACGPTVPSRAEFGFLIFLVFFFYTTASNHLHIDRFDHFTVFWNPPLLINSNTTALLSRFQTSPLSYKVVRTVIQKENSSDIFSILYLLY